MFVRLWFLMREKRKRQKKSRVLKQYDSLVSLLNNEEELAKFNKLAEVAQDMHDMLSSKIAEIKKSEAVDNEDDDE